MVGQLPEKNVFDKYAKMGLLKSVHDDEQGLTCYCYNEFCQFSRLWNAVTRQARGIVFADDGRLVQRCVPKFFNYEEPDGIADRAIYGGEPVVVEEKLDGCLIKVTNDPELDLVVTSKCSFNNEFVDDAMWYITDRYQASYKKIFEEGKTYSFELIDPRTRTATVIDYGNEVDMVLWAVVDNATGKEENIYNKKFDMFTRPTKYSSGDISIFRHSDNFSSQLCEGVVIKYPNYRLKIKTEEYLRLFRAKSRLNEKMVWEHLRDYDPLVHKDVPEEFWGWLDETTDKFIHQFNKLKDEAECITNNYMSPKLIANLVGYNPSLRSAAICYAKGKDKNGDRIIWNQLKPVNGKVVGK